MIVSSSGGRKFDDRDFFRAIEFVFPVIRGVTHADVHAFIKAFPGERGQDPKNLYHRVQQRPELKMGRVIFGLYSTGGIEVSVHPDQFFERPQVNYDADVRESGFPFVGQAGRGGIDS